jgi:hypothetical protein
MRRISWAVALMVVSVGCHRTTATLTPELEARFQQEQILRRADDQVFRYTYGGGRWENRDASIIVTRQSVYIHKNEKVGLDMTGSSRRAYEVHRDHQRIIIGAGSGQSRVSWSFEPPDGDADGWAKDIRAVVSAVTGD